MIQPAEIFNRCTYRCTYPYAYDHLAAASPSSLLVPPNLFSTENRLEITYIKTSLIKLVKAYKKRRLVLFPFAKSSCMLMLPIKNRGEKAGMKMSNTNNHNYRFDVQQLSKLFYTVQEASDLLSIGRSTMYAKLKSGEITAVYPTSSARIPATAIMRYANNLESEERRHRSRTKAGQNPCKIRGNSDASQKEGVQ